jgi:hypothetical protein
VLALCVEVESFEHYSILNDYGILVSYIYDMTEMEHVLFSERELPQ